MAKRKSYSQLNQKGKDKVAVSTAIGTFVPFGAAVQTYKSSRSRGSGRGASTVKGAGVGVASSIYPVGIGVGAYAGYRRGMHRAQDKNPKTTAKVGTHAPTKTMSRSTPKKGRM